MSALEKEYRVEEGELEMLKSLGIIGVSEYQDAKSALRSDSKFTSLFVQKKQDVQSGASLLEVFQGIEEITGEGNTMQEMIRVPKGRFQMGASQDNTEAKSQVRPSFQVELTRSFWMSKMSVTQQCWLAVMEKNPSTYKGDMRPVDSIPWKDCLEFCNKMSQREGLEEVYTFFDEQIICNFDANGYRLPTSAEWEYAARAGKTDQEQRFSGSSDVGDVAWTSSMVKETKEVGQKKPNEWGFHDMSGNVWEWTWDGYHAQAYNGYSSSSVVKDPQGIAYSEKRNIRGGSYHDGDMNSMVCSNLGVPATAKYRNVGMRLMKTITN